MENSTVARYRFAVCVLFLFALLAVPIKARAETRPIDSCNELPSRSIIDATMNRDFSKARKLLQQWQDQAPNGADALFYSATIDMAEAKTQRKAGFKKFNAIAMEKLKRVEKKLSTTHNRSYEQTLTLGMAEAFIARLNMENEKWLDAYNIGRRARDRLRTLLRAAPHLENANLVLGLYEFYTGDVPVTLKWLTYLVDLSGSRKRGIELLEHSIEFATTASPEAARTLIDELELKAPEICQWLPLNEHMRSSYPSNPRFAWRLQRHYRECGFPKKALEENIQATHQFAGYSNTRKHLLSDRGAIYRDLGDVEGLKSLADVSPRLKHLDRWLREARYVRGVKSGKKYTPPAKINNARPLLPHNSCDSHLSEPTGN